MITKDMILAGLRDEILTLTKDPNADHGTVCSIKNEWFYFGGITAEEEDPDEYAANVPIADIVDEIYSVLEDFRMYGDESEQIIYKFIERELTKTTQKYRVGLAVSGSLVITVEASSAEDASKKAKEIWGYSDLGLLVDANCEVAFVEDGKGNLC